MGGDVCDVVGLGYHYRGMAIRVSMINDLELKPILHELKGIGRNLNQLTMLSHQGVIHTVNLTATSEAIGRCYQAINKLYASTDGVIGSGEN